MIFQINWNTENNGWSWKVENPTDLIVTYITQPREHGQKSHSIYRTILKAVSWPMYLQYVSSIAHVQKIMWNSTFLSASGNLPIVHEGINLSTFPASVQSLSWLIWIFQNFDSYHGILNSRTCNLNFHTSILSSSFREKMPHLPPPSPKHVCETFPWCSEAVVHSHKVQEMQLANKIPKET